MQLQVGGSWGHLGSKLGDLGGHLGSELGGLGAILEVMVRSRRNFGEILGSLELRGEVGKHPRARQWGLVWTSLSGSNGLH